MGKKTSSKLLLAYIDESGSPGAKSDGYYLMSAVLVDGERLYSTRKDWLRKIAEVKRTTLDKALQQNTHFVKQTLADKMALSHAVSLLDGITLITVVVNHPTSSGIPRMSARREYYTALGYLLERVSWVARDRDRKATCTIAQWCGTTQPEMLRQIHYLAKLKGSTIDGDWLDIDSTRVKPISQEPLLQLADVVASGTRAAFTTGSANPKKGITPKYLLEFSSLLYRNPRGCDRRTVCDLGCLRSYGLKLAFWNRKSEIKYGYIYHVLGGCTHTYRNGTPNGLQALYLNTIDKFSDVIWKLEKRLRNLSRFS